jgi:hypothetical protein
MPTKREKVTYDMEKNPKNELGYLTPYVFQLTGQTKRTMLVSNMCVRLTQEGNIKFGLSSERKEKGEPFHLVIFF